MNLLTLYFKATDYALTVSLQMQTKVYTVSNTMTAKL